MSKLNPQSYNLYRHNGIVHINFSESGKRDGWYDIKKLKEDSGILAHSRVIIGYSYQDWFVNSFPTLIDRIENLAPGIMVKYSHVELGNKFGVFNND